MNPHAEEHRAAGARTKPMPALRCSLGLILLLAAAVSSAAKNPPEALDAATGSASLAGVVHDQDAQPADLTAEATYRLPGLLRKDSSLEELRQRFGKANVAVETIDGAEGETARGIVLFDADPARRAEIFVQDETTLRGIATVRVRGSQSRWRLDNGLHLGMSLAALVAANGKPITFSGLDWDYGGGIRDWHQGRLAPREGDTVFRAVTLTHGDTVEDGAIPLGDGEFRSDDKRYPRQGELLSVGELLVSFPQPDAQ